MHLLTNHSKLRAACTLLKGMGFEEAGEEEMPLAKLNHVGAKGP